MNDIRLPDEDAPLFKLFWHNSQLNGAQGQQMAERIGIDSALPYVASRPRFAQPTTPLVPPTNPSSATWKRRRSERVFSSTAITTQHLSELCWPFAARADGSRHSASGGAKYPILIYAALLQIAGASTLQNTLAWYDPQAHGFTPFAACPPWETLAKALSVDWTTAPSVVFFITARSKGSLAKYGERGGRFILLEAGSYMGALGYEAARLDLSGVAVGSMRDAAVADLLQLDSQIEMPVLAYACGASIAS
jgi:SagB-type dehydrogenase family enzyme